MTPTAALLAISEGKTVYDHDATVRLLCWGLIEPKDPQGYALTPEGHSLLIRASMRALQ